MCDGIEKLRKMKIKKELRCTVNASCWCMRVSNEFPTDWTSDCMSPAEMLAQTEFVLSKKDSDYLKMLVGHEFMRSGE